VLHDTRSAKHGLVIDIGGGSTEVTLARGGVPKILSSLPLGTVRLTELYDASDRVEPARLDEMRAFAREVIAKSMRGSAWEKADNAYGSSGTIRSLAAFIGPRKARTVKRSEVTRAVDALAALSARERRKHFEPSRADVIVSGAVVLESLMRELDLDRVTSVDRGLRDGILLDMLARRNGGSPALRKAAGG
jgi:exopolyphosphatase/guanosine-5'-triphosphate,3'-diphosphate pyrophosphatase